MTTLFWVVQTSRMFLSSQGKQSHRPTVAQPKSKLKLMGSPLLPGRRCSCWLASFKVVKFSDTANDLHSLYTISHIRIRNPKTLIELHWPFKPYDHCTVPGTEALFLSLQLNTMSCSPAFWGYGSQRVAGCDMQSGDQMVKFATTPSKGVGTCESS